MYELPPPPPTELHCEISAFTKTKDLACALAFLGSLWKKENPYPLIEEILSLYIEDEEEGWEFAATSDYTYFLSEEARIIPCGFFKSTKKISKNALKKTARFISKHKEKIIAGIATFVGTGAAAYAFSGDDDDSDTLAESIGFLRTEPPPKIEENPPETPPLLFEEKSDPEPALYAHYEKEISPEEPEMFFTANETPEKSEPSPSLKNHFDRIIREGSVKFVHDFIELINDTKISLSEIRQYLEDQVTASPFKKIVEVLSSPDDIESPLWRKPLTEEEMLAVHEKLDDVFNTNLAPKYKNHPEEEILLGEIPPPSSLGKSSSKSLKNFSSSQKLKEIKKQAPNIGEHIQPKESLTRSQIKSYLSNAKSLSKEKIVKDLQALGLKIKGKSPDGKFIELQDKKGNLRVKIHPPDKVTKYDHIHIYDKSGNSLSKDLNLVDKSSVDAHIRIGAQNENH